MDKMETTENLGLKKPSQDDYYNVDDFNYNADAIDEFCGRTDNPHNVTKEQIGLKNVPNVSTNDQTPTYTEASTLEALKSGEKLSVAFGKIAKAIKDFISHIVTKASSTVLGHVKLTDSSTVTDGTGYALPATEKNASIKGTLANQISKVDSDLENRLEWKKSDIEVVGLRYYGNFNEWMRKCNASELMFIVSDGYYSYSFVFPVNIYTVLRKSDFSSGDMSSYASVSYNEYGQNGTGELAVAHLYKDGNAVADEDITIKLYYR